MGKIRTRYGDGSPVELSEGEVMQDLEEGTQDAAQRGNIPVLSKEELQHLFDIFQLASPVRGRGTGQGNCSFLRWNAN